MASSCSSVWNQGSSVPHRGGCGTGRGHGCLGPAPCPGCWAAILAGASSSALGAPVQLRAHRGRRPGRLLASPGAASGAASHALPFCGAAAGPRPRRRRRRSFSGSLSTFHRRLCRTFGVRAIIIIVGGVQKRSVRRTTEAPMAVQCGRTVGAGADPVLRRGGSANDSCPRALPGDGGGGGVSGKAAAVALREDMAAASSCGRACGTWRRRRRRRQCRRRGTTSERGDRGRARGNGRRGGLPRRGPAAAAIAPLSPSAPRLGGPDATRTATGVSTTRTDADEAAVIAAATSVRRGGAAAARPRSAGRRSRGPGERPSFFLSCRGRASKPRRGGGRITTQDAAGAGRARGAPGASVPPPPPPPYRGEGHR